MQAVCQFNSALSTIHHDVAVLVRSAAVGFDGLPREMVAILEAVWSGRMPLKWCKGVCSETLPLKDGMTGTAYHHELFEPIINAHDTICTSVPVPCPCPSVSVPASLFLSLSLSLNEFNFQVAIVQDKS